MPRAKPSVKGICKKCGHDTGSRNRKWCDDHRPPSKYGSKRTMIGSRTFHSKKEAGRWLELKAMAENGEIRNLKCQVPFNLIIEGMLIARYIADFSYLDDTGAQVIEDVKSRWTKRDPVYVIKKKLMKALLNIQIVET